MSEQKIQRMMDQALRMEKADELKAMHERLRGAAAKEAAANTAEGREWWATMTGEVDTAKERVEALIEHIRSGDPKQPEMLNDVALKLEDIRAQLESVQNRYQEWEDVHEVTPDMNKSEAPASDAAEKAA